MTKDYLVVKMTEPKSHLYVFVITSYFPIPLNTKQIRSTISVYEKKIKIWMSKEVVFDLNKLCFS